MSYTPYLWETGEIITADKLNHIENGIGGVDDAISTIEDNYVTPEQFGAVGDGTTDDSSALQSAINSGKTIIFQHNQYAISQGLTVSTAIVIPNNVTIKALSSMSAILSVTGTSDTIRIIGGILDCNEVADTGISLSNTYGAYIQNVKVLNAAESGIDISGGAHNWIVNCKVFNQATLATGISLNSSDTRVINSEIYYTSLGIKNLLGILFVSNTHIWSGGSANSDTTPVGIEIKSSTSAPSLFCDQVYLDSFYAGIDGGTRVCTLHLTNTTFYWGSETVPDSVYGIIMGNGSALNIKSCLFSTSSGSTITKTDILRGTQNLKYTGTYEDISSIFSVTSQASKTVLTASVKDSMLYLDFVVDAKALTTDDSNWIRIIETVNYPAVFMNISRMDFTVYNYTKTKGVGGRIERLTGGNQIVVRIKGDIAIDDRLYGSIVIPVA